MVKAVTQINILPSVYYLKLNHNVFKIRVELVAVFVGHFGFLFMFFALKQTHCAFVACDSE